MQGRSFVLALAPFEPSASRRQYSTSSHLLEPFSAYARFLPLLAHSANFTHQAKLQRSAQGPASDVDAGGAGRCAPQVETPYSCLKPLTTFASVEAFTLFPLRIARIVLRSSPVSLVVFLNPHPLISAIKLSLAATRPPS